MKLNSKDIIKFKLLKNHQYARMFKEKMVYGLCIQ